MVELKQFWQSIIQYASNKINLSWWTSKDKRNIFRMICPRNDISKHIFGGIPLFSDEYIFGLHIDKFYHHIRKCKLCILVAIKLEILMRLLLLTEQWFPHQIMPNVSYEQKAFLSKCIFSYCLFWILIYKMYCISVSNSMLRVISDIIWLNFILLITKLGS